MPAPLFVLLVTDTSACLTIPGGDIIEAADDWQPLAAALNADPQRPVRLVLDSAEQFYEQVTVKLRNPLDRHRLLARKLATLSAHPETAGLHRLAGGHYLLAAAGDAAGLQTALALLARTGNPLHDIALDSMEASRYLIAQFPALAAGWSIATIGSRLSGFRQLVLREGQTVFGRLIPPARDAAAWEREIASLLTYLPRLGLPRETPIALVTNLDQAPLGSLDFPGGTVGELFFLPAGDRDFTTGLLAWHAGQRGAAMPIAPRHWRLERLSHRALRVACCVAAVIALSGAMASIHLHHQTKALVAAAASESQLQAQLAAELAAERAADGRATEMRLALALQQAAAGPASQLPRVAGALATLPPALGLQELEYQRAPLAIRATLASDPLSQVPKLSKQLPGLAVTASGTSIQIVAP